MNRVLTAIMFGALALAAGCGAGPTNPSFAVTIPQAKAALREMQSHPKPLARPLVVVGGWLDPGIAASQLSRDLRDATRDARVVGVSMGACWTFDACRNHLLEEVERAFPSGDPRWTSEVDVVAYSMGGLVARYAAAEGAEASNPRRLRIRRLFTISTPHRGAAMAAVPTLNAIQIDMRSGSRFLRELEAGEQHVDYELYTYVRLGDGWIGEANAAPVGQVPWWVPNPTPWRAHNGARNDERIVADIARRLRDEPPFTTQPPAPLPAR